MFSFARPGFGTRTIAFAGLYGAFVLAGCGPGAGSEEAGGAGASLTPDVEEAYRVGSAEGGRWDSFSRIVSAAFDSAGRLHLLDADEHRITVVEPDGSLARRFGVQGEGPGELRRPQALAVLPSGEIAIADSGHRGYLLFSADGEFLRTLPLAEGDAGAGLTFPHGPDGLVYASRGIRIEMRGGGPPQLPTDIPVRRVAVPEEEAEEPPPVELLHRAWRPPVELEGSGTGGMGLPGPRAFEPRFHLAVLPDGRLAVADSSTYRIRILDRSGTEEAVVGRPVDPRPVTETDRERERERRLTELAEGRGPQVQIATTGPGGGTQVMGTNDLREMLEEQIRNMDFWPEIPVITGLAADRAGRLWVTRVAEDDDDTTGAGAIDLLTPEGEHLGTIPTGALTTPDAFGPGGLAAWIERDELDIPYVRVARVDGLP